MASIGGDEGAIGNAVAEIEVENESERRHERLEQEQYLPIANIQRIMKAQLPGTAKVTKDAKETVQECLTEFISFVTSEAVEKCHTEKRKTLSGEDLIEAMSVLGFDNLVEPLKLFLSKYRDGGGGKVYAKKRGPQSKRRVSAKKQAVESAGTPMPSIAESSSILSIGSGSNTGVVTLEDSNRSVPFLPQPKTSFSGPLHNTTFAASGPPSTAACAEYGSTATRAAPGRGGAAYSELRVGLAPPVPTSRIDSAFSGFNASDVEAPPAPAPSRKLISEAPKSGESVRTGASEDYSSDPAGDGEPGAFIAGR